MVCKPAKDVARRLGIEQRMDGRVDSRWMEEWIAVEARKEG